MNQKEFVKEIELRLKEYLPDDIRNSGEIRTHLQIKNNDKQLHGISIYRGDYIPSPVIYIDDFYENHKNGMPMESILQNIAETFESALQKKPDLSDINLTLDEVEKKVVCRVVNMKMNQTRLHEMKHTPIGNGYALTYHIELNGEMSIPVSRSLAESKGYDMRILHEAAMENTERRYPANLQAMRQKLFGELVDAKANNLLLNKEQNISDEQIYVLSNDIQHFGAVTLFYQGVKEKIGDIVGGDYYAVPSSMHEFLIFPKKDGIDASGLQNILRTVNRDEVAEEDILGDKVLEYNSAEKTLKTAEPEKVRNEERGR